MNKVEKLKKAVETFSNSRIHTPKSQCPKCRRLLDAASSVEAPKARPSPGDCTVCIYCRSILEFDNSLKLIFAKDSTLKKIAGTDSLIMSNELSSILKKDVKK